MASVAFNTYDFVKSLEDAGMDEKHAAAISAGILRAHEVADLATKADIDLAVVSLRTEMREEHAQLREDHALLRAEMRESQTQNKADLRELELRMTIKLGSMMIIAVGVLTAVIKFL